MWLWAHFLFWDYTQTRPGERFTMRALIGFITNPGFALYNQMLVWTTVKPLPPI